MPAIPFRSFRHAARRLLQVPGFTITALLTLALGIGATTTVFSVVYGVLLRPLPYPGADRLVSLSHTLVVGETLRVEQSDASLLFYPRHARAFTNIGGYQAAAAALGASGSGDAERVAAGRVTAGVLPALGVAPIRGRVFTEADDRPGAPPVAVISEALWARKYGADPSILQRRVDIDGRPHEVVGVMPKAFRFPDADTALWLPLRLDPARTDSATFDFHGIARLRDDVSADAAARELQALLLRLPDEFPGRLTRAAIDQTQMQASVRPLVDVVIGDIAGVLWIVLGAAACVLAIACANVANLFLVRSEGRRQAMAIQRALGADRAAIVLELFAEGVLVGAIGGAIGLAAAVACVRILEVSGSAIDIPRLAEIRVDMTVAAVAVILTMLATLCVTALAALRSSTAAMASLLGATTRATASPGRHRVRHALVAAQVALALVLLAGSGLMAKTVWRLGLVTPGVDPAHVTTFRIALPQASYPGPEDAARFYLRAVDEIGRLPGVDAAGVVSKVPLDPQGKIDTAVFVEDRPREPGTLPAIHPVAYATPGYFDAASIPVVEGRRFTAPDPPRTPLEAMVSRAFAARYWGTESPIGRRVRILLNGPWYTVVGVVGDVRDAGLDRPVDSILYCPILPPREDARWAPRDLAVIVRSSADPASVTAGIRDTVRRVDPSLPIYRLQPLTAIVEQASARRAFVFALMTWASAAALLLGAVGLYGVMSYVVTLRAPEIGLRIALGARPGQVRWMVSRQGLLVAATGVMMGLAGAAAITRLLAGLLFEVTPTDPGVFGGAALLLIFVAAAATWLPARRAAAVDPAQTLKA